MIPPGGVIWGHPLDDPGCNLWWYEIIPVGFGSGPWPCCCLFPAGGFRTSDPKSTVATGQILAAQGFICFCSTYRVRQNKVDGQTTDGHYDQQVVDVRHALVTARNDGRTIDNMIYGLGGSGGATHVMDVAVSGTDRWNAAICFSGSYDFSLKTPEDYTFDKGGGQQVDPVANMAILCADYVGTQVDNNPALLAASPIAHLTSLTSLPPIAFYGSEHDPMPAHQRITMADKFASIGATAWFSKELTGGAHAFANFPAVQQEVIDYLLDPSTIGTGGGNTPPPPPDNNLLDYTFWVTSDITGATATVPDVVTSVDQSAQITQITPPSTLFTAHLIANNIYGPSPEATATFTSNPATSGGGTGGGKSISGIYTLLDQVNGVVTDLSNKAFWDLPYIDGSHWIDRWDRLQPNQGPLITGDLDDYMAMCAAKQKKAIISISAGIHTPSWVYSQGAAPITFTGSPNAGTMPIPWDANYIKFFVQFLQSLSLLYATNPALIGIVIGGGLGRTNDTNLTTTAPDTTILDDAATTAGFTDIIAAWTPAAQRIIQTYNKVFPKINILADMELVVPLTYSPDGEAGEQSISDILVGPDGSQRLSNGFFAEGLTSSSDTTRFANLLVSQNSPTHPAGFRMAAASSTEAQFGAALTTGVGMNARFIEVFEADAEDIDPAHVTHLTAARQAMIDNFQGGTP